MPGVFKQKVWPTYKSVPHYKVNLSSDLEFTSNVPELLEVGRILGREGVPLTGHARVLKISFTERPSQEENEYNKEGEQSDLAKQLLALWHLLKFFNEVNINPNDYDVLDVLAGTNLLSNVLLGIMWPWQQELVPFLRKGVEGQWSYNRGLLTAPGIPSILEMYVTTEADRAFGMENLKVSVIRSDHTGATVQPLTINFVNQMQGELSVHDFMKGGVRLRGNIIDIRFVSSDLRYDVDKKRAYGNFLIEFDRINDSVELGVKIISVSNVLTFSSYDISELQDVNKITVFTADYLIPEDI